MFLKLFKRAYIYYYYNFDKYEKWKDIRESLDTEKNMNTLISKLFYYNEVNFIKNKFFNYIINKVRNDHYFALKLLYSRFYIYFLYNLKTTKDIEKFIYMFYLIINNDRNTINNFIENYDIEYVLIILFTHMHKSKIILAYYTETLELFSCDIKLKDIIFNNVKQFVHRKNYKVIKNEKQSLTLLLHAINNILQKPDIKIINTLLPVIRDMTNDLYEFFKKYNHFLLQLNVFIKILFFKTSDKKHISTITRFLVIHNFFNKLKKIKKTPTDLLQPQIQLFHMFYGFNNFYQINRLQISLYYSFYDIIYYYFVLNPKKITNKLYINNGDDKMLNYIILLSDHNFILNDIRGINKYRKINYFKINKINTMYKNKIKKEFDKIIKRKYDINLVDKVFDYIDYRDDVYINYLE